MKNIIPPDSRYVSLTQQRWCCVPTCIQMVMLRHHIPLISAELLGYHMGLIVPKEELQYFWNGRTGQKPLSGFGTQLGKREYGPNFVFKQLHIPLRMTWSLINKFPTIETFQAYLSKIKDQDILVCFDWGSLFGGEYHDGHVCVLDRVFLHREEVRIIDPEFYAPKWRTVSISKLYEAMKYHGKEKGAGFWEIHRT